MKGDSGSNQVSLIDDILPESARRKADLSERYI